MRRDFLLLLGRGHERGRLRHGELFTSQVPSERAQRGELASRRRSRSSMAVQHGEVPAHRIDVDIGRSERRDGLAAFPAHEGHELTEIAVVRSQGVRRHIAVEAEVFQKFAKVMCHIAPLATAASCPASQRSTSRSARSEIASLRSCLSRGGFGTGSMIPNVMFDGS